MSKKSIYKKIITENAFVQAPKESTDVIANNKDAFDFFTSKRVFGEASWDSPPPFSSSEAKQQVDKDLNTMSTYLGKASLKIKHTYRGKEHFFKVGLQEITKEEACG